MTITWISLIQHRQSLSIWFINLQYIGSSYKLRVTWMLGGSEKSWWIYCWLLTKFPIQIQLIPCNPMAYEPIHKPFTLRETNDGRCGKTHYDLVDHIFPGKPTGFPHFSERTSTRMILQVLSHLISSLCSSGIFIECIHVSFLAHDISIWKFLQKTSFHPEIYSISIHFYFQLFSIYLSSYPQYIPSFIHIIVISSWCPSKSMAPWPEAPEALERRLVSHLLSMSQSFGRDLDERRAGAGRALFVGGSSNHSS